MTDIQEQLQRPVDAVRRLAQDLAFASYDTSDADRLRLLRAATPEEQWLILVFLTGRCPEYVDAAVRMVTEDRERRAVAS